MLKAKIENLDIGQKGFRWVQKNNITYVVNAILIAKSHVPNKVWVYVSDKDTAYTEQVHVDDIIWENSVDLNFLFAVCDCGAEAVGDPGHAHYCSRQKFLEGKQDG